MRQRFQSRGLPGLISQYGRYSGIEVRFYLIAVRNCASPGKQPHLFSTTAASAIRLLNDSNFNRFISGDIMISRRSLLSGAATAAFVTPSILRAHTKEPFVLAEEFQPREVRVREQHAPGQILVFPRLYYLYHVFDSERAIRYGVGVGKAGLEFKGTAIIERKAEWPSWRPTNDMIRRDPDRYAQFADGVPGGPGNPLGARALYLYKDGRDTYFRIHGTTDPASIGQSVSNGCIRMLNDHVKQLYDQVPVGTPVTVL
ncbi:L,D-transpeptidase [Pseudotabrizicola sp.]|uniref:L,D-transpeptidase n=1 Tax=Pseudotabrizicola sp. TaxID=2939647 RepID=UPI00351DB072